MTVTAVPIALKIARLLRQIFNYEIRRDECSISSYNFLGVHFKIKSDKKILFRRKLRGH
jgi:hypothetical protein